MRGAALCVLLVLAMCVASAAVPQTMSYQGVLRDSGGNIVHDGSYDLTFALYNVPSGGVALWTEEQSLTVEGGIFDAVLGASVPIALGFGEDYWLGISIETEPELAPRIRLTSAPYARRAEYADNSGDDGDWSVNGVNLYRYVGNVGIGTVVPAFELDINRDADGFTGLRIKNNDTGPQSREGIYFGNEDGDQAGISTYDDDSVYASAMIIGNNRPNGNIRLSTVGAERMRIDNLGYVGIGVTGPSRLLDVGGGVKMQAFEMPTGAAAGRVLTSDAVGEGTWQDVPGFALPYEGTGAVAETSAVFKIWSTGTGSAIYGQNSHTYGGTAGYLADTFDGVVGEHFETRNFGTLGSYYYGVHAKARADHATAIYGRHDPSMHYAQLANNTYAGYFSGDVAIENGYLGVGTDSPVEDLDVDGEVDITSSADATILHVLNGYIGNLARLVDIERLSNPTTGNDIVEISAGTGGVDSFQFIECDRAGIAQWAVNGDGTTTSKGARVSKEVQLCEMMPVYGGARSVQPGDVMVIDPSSRRTLAQSSNARSTLVAGIYCEDPGLVGSGRGWTDEGVTDDERTSTYSIEDMANEFDEIPLAVVGVVPCRVSAENGAISPGDLLVTSDTPGHAMRDASPSAGTVVGKALERLDAGSGVIDVLVTLQ